MKWKYCHVSYDANSQVVLSVYKTQGPRESKTFPVSDMYQSFNVFTNVIAGLGENGWEVFHIESQDGLRFFLKKQVE